MSDLVALTLDSDQYPHFCMLCGHYMEAPIRLQGGFS